MVESDLCCQGDSTPGLAAGERLMGKWFIGRSAPTSTSQEPSAASATPRPAGHHGNTLQVPLVTYYLLIRVIQSESRRYNLMSHYLRPLSWVTGDWEACSASCGQTGWQRRWVSCQQESSSGQQQRAVPSKFCSDDRPESKQTCNRFPCPAAWRAGPWTPVRRFKLGLWTTSDLVLSDLPVSNLRTFFYRENL